MHIDGANIGLFLTLLSLVIAGVVQITRSEMHLRTIADTAKDLKELPLLRQKVETLVTKVERIDSDIEDLKIESAMHRGRLDSTGKFT